MKVLYAYLLSFLLLDHHQTALAAIYKKRGKAMRRMKMKGSKEIISALLSKWECSTWFSGKLKKEERTWELSNPVTSSFVLDGYANMGAMTQGSSGTYRIPSRTYKAAMPFGAPYLWPTIVRRSIPWICTSIATLPSDWDVMCCVVMRDVMWCNMMVMRCEVRCHGVMWCVVRSDVVQHGGKRHDRRQYKKKSNRSKK